MGAALGDFLVVVALLLEASTAWAWLPAETEHRLGSAAARITAAAEGFDRLRAELAAGGPTTSRLLAGLSLEDLGLLRGEGVSQELMSRFLNLQSRGPKERHGGSFDPADVETLRLTPRLLARRKRENAAFFGAFECLRLPQPSREGSGVGFPSARGLWKRREGAVRQHAPAASCTGGGRVQPGGTSTRQQVKKPIVTTGLIHGTGELLYDIYAAAYQRFLQHHVEKHSKTVRDALEPMMPPDPVGDICQTVGVEKQEIFRRVDSAAELAANARDQAQAHGSRVHSALASGSCCRRTRESFPARLETSSSSAFGL
ncbi:hypothetical protein AK812_SmicGene19053 [Symbiodinium microadriaticum]|uniref:Uncharacterized protein n=1 Tax=Symbiodinium microadriaticum TaxID=2951 RepID=A0A1Q9DTL2_SYMMI|nr:hypothetical protein AK812_SmicGene19053 [Symbiodinium microadriaticum]